ncbi:MAG: prolipoprotein diacylglyceryl transferase, partial [Ruminiclostridium sp.]|nr:prolipoprotein diacylglyceryl transferase [Ruminiclostridium sp.]
MYPYRLFLDIDLYTVFLCLAVAGAIINFRFFAEKRKMSWKLSNLVVVSAAAAILFGYFSAVLFQALYNVEKLGKFVIDTSTGATFYGGLIGGAACFLLFYFVVGGFVFKDGEHVKGFFAVADIASASIVIAHAFGRIGCLMAGCCHGGATDKWYGIYMSAWGER